MLKHLFADRAGSVSISPERFGCLRANLTSLSTTTSETPFQFVRDTDDNIYKIEVRTDHGTSAIRISRAASGQLEDLLNKL